ncbi:unnamed protein product [Hermetia illucens]|uniref:Carbonic anhydrase n=1 Tax=Hermetia illucens TaxID=343691 RepID=A0A7R8V5L2_HERIL|nr:carbonic anhydrase 2-like [Hermetia illucens]CAD7093290.1 unnamed protein product [Hermetia illucens]
MPTLPDFVFLVLIYFAGSAYCQFGYSTAEQKRWAVDFPQCGGSSQSPIEIYTGSVIPAFIPRLKLYGYDWPLPFPVILKNDGKTADVSSLNTDVTRYPHLAFLNSLYRFVGFHFHWGKNQKGSEHVVNGKSYPVELHIVHRNVKYSESQALNFQDGLLVLGIFFEVSSVDNPNLYSVTNYLRYIRAENATTTISTHCSLGGLLGSLNINKFYTYQGSLTTPPCSETVTWIVFANILNISHRQLNEFRQLIGTDGKIIRNYRHLQPLNGRPVYVRSGSKWRG